MGIGAASLGFGVTGEPRPAAADDENPCAGLGCDVNPTEPGYNAEAVAAEHAELNKGRGGGAAEQCDDEDTAPGAGWLSGNWPTLLQDDNDDPDRFGHLEWTDSNSSGSSWVRVLGENPDDYTDLRGPRYYYEVCVFDGGPTVWAGGAQLFTNATGENLARWIIDQALLGIPYPEPRFSPEGRQLVALDTWLWADNVPADGTLALRPVSVPGITVNVTATTTTLDWYMGTGDRFDCAVGTPYNPATPGASPTCSYTYQRAGGYAGDVSVVWSATYLVNGTGPYTVPEAIVRTTGFDLDVNHAEAVVVD